jgi:hypothetical protein
MGLKAGDLSSIMELSPDNFGDSRNCSSFCIISNCSLIETFLFFDVFKALVGYALDISISKRAFFFFLLIFSCWNMIFEPFYYSSYFQASISTRPSLFLNEEILILF